MFLHTDCRTVPLSIVKITALSPSAKCSFLPICGKRAENNAKHSCLLKLTHNPYRSTCCSRAAPHFLTDVLLGRQLNYATLLPQQTGFSAWVGIARLKSGKCSRASSIADAQLQRGNRFSPTWPILVNQLSSFKCILHLSCGQIFPGKSFPCCTH